LCRQVPKPVKVKNNFEADVVNILNINIEILRVLSILTVELGLKYLTEFAIELRFGVWCKILIL
jgi:hypothetical protein